LRRLHRGVYLVGAVAPERAFEHAAVLACGDRAYASHQTAATLYGLPPTCPTDRCSRHGPKSRRAPVRDHRPPHASLSREETQLLDGIPTTSPARTIVDLARELGPADLEHLLAQAYAKKRVTRAKLLAVVALSVRPGPVSER
jgi:hypothetical protein